MGRCLSPTKVWGVGSSCPVLSHFRSHRSLLLMTLLLQAALAQPIWPQYRLLRLHTYSCWGDTSHGRAGRVSLGAVSFSAPGPGLGEGAGGVGLGPDDPCLLCLHPSGLPPAAPPRGPQVTLARLLQGACARSRSKRKLGSESRRRGLVGIGK